MSFSHVKLSHTDFGQTLAGPTGKQVEGLYVDRKITPLGEQSDQVNKDFRKTELEPTGEQCRPVLGRTA